ncbi:class E basic helix-loop-helix protein 41 isoform X2 [Nerophis ophidion]|uniref:class E basic helix-loop-helix protein 41 isoform X2 n=1 Tax=Nerophis ophidion TaxID=159077 RepID=UPI002AE09261|nr:class E basic helix-loop-helix protein 41 isoform X2 [Nerophis ophidion]
MDERIEHLHDRHFMDRADFLGVDYPSLYMCKPKRGIKREDGGKDAYKLPHRLIEKKRRDRINECIGQLKDLLPEHLKLSTLGHLEKAVVLELTLKHLNALTAVTEQQHQKIVALQNGEKTSVHADLDAFHSGFQTCAKEVLQHLSQFENWTTREQSCTQLVKHLHKVLAQVQSGAAADCPKVDNQVPVIQRTQGAGGDVTENDTDTDSGYGGEAEKGEGKECEGGGKKIKQEFADDRPAKKAKMNWSLNAPSDVAFMNSLMGLSGVGQQTPVCMPFYFINPSAAASYMPFFDKSTMEKCVYPTAGALASPFPWLYPAQAAAAFPGFSPPCKDPPPCGDEAEVSSPEERRESDGSNGDVSGASQESRGDLHDQFPVSCQSS